ncbi:MAG: hypothetical protein ACNS60_21340, partial [Candidatus Cyclobacteriaceae bacterium M2_1C_046]
MVDLAHLAIFTQHVGLTELWFLAAPVYTLSVSSNLHSMKGFDYIFYRVSNFYKKWDDDTNFTYG